MNNIIKSSFQRNPKSSIYKMIKNRKLYIFVKTKAIQRKFLMSKIYILNHISVILCADTSKMTL